MWPPQALPRPMPWSCAPPERDHAHRRDRFYIPLFVRPPIYGMGSLIHFLM